MENPVQPQPNETYLTRRTKINIWFATVCASIWGVIFFLVCWTEFDSDKHLPPDATTGGWVFNGGMFKAWFLSVFITTILGLCGWGLLEKCNLREVVAFRGRQSVSMEKLLVGTLFKMSLDMVSTFFVNIYLQYHGRKRLDYVLFILSIQSLLHCVLAGAFAGGVVDLIMLLTTGSSTLMCYFISNNNLTGAVTMLAVYLAAILGLAVYRGWMVSFVKSGQE